MRQHRLSETDVRQANHAFKLALSLAATSRFRFAALRPNRGMFSENAALKLEQISMTALSKSSAREGKDLQRLSQ